MTHVSQRRYKFGQDTHEAKNVVSEPCNKGEGIDTHRQRTGLIPCYAGPGPRPYSLLACKRFGQSRYLISSSTKGRDGAKCPLGMPPSASESIRALWQRCKHLKFLCSWQGTYPSFFVLVHWIYPFFRWKRGFLQKWETQVIFAYIGLTCDQGVCKDEKTSPFSIKGEVFYYTKN